MLQNGNIYHLVTVLIVEDDEFLRRKLQEVLIDEGLSIVVAGDGKTALHLLDDHAIDLMLLDLKLPRVSGMDVLRHTADAHPEVPVVIISGEGTIPTAVEAMRLGIYDFIEKPLTIDRILLTVRNALEKRRLQHQRDRLLEEVEQRYRMIGAGGAMQQIYELIDRAAKTHSKVLITGEHGAGKELVARAIHYNSDRASGPFVTVNCAAIPESLIESELFGYEKGAFTNALSSTPGKFEQASDGTLFLDEIGDMSLMTQAKTLRVLSEDVVERLGKRQPIPIDARIIAATNKDLEQTIQDGSFREDLYYRLNVITIHIPPLRERREDIPDLTKHFLSLFCKERNLTPHEPDPQVLTLLMEYNWPGNIRQLRNLIEQLVALSDDGALDVYDVAAALKIPHQSPAMHTDLREAREHFERDFIRESLIARQWKIQETAHALGIERSNLWKKMQRYGIKRVR